MRCKSCNTDLSGGLDTYGLCDTPLCATCFHFPHEDVFVREVKRMCAHCKGTGECACKLCSLLFDECYSCDGTGFIDVEETISRAVIRGTSWGDTERKLDYSLLRPTIYERHEKNDTRAACEGGYRSGKSCSPR